MKTTFVTALCFLFLTTLTSCKSDDGGGSSGTNSDTMANQLGDAMASMDDMGNTDGSYSQLGREQKTFARLMRTSVKIPASDYALTHLLPKAEALACSGVAYSGCTSNVNTRNFSGCTVGRATITGSVTYNFTDGNVNNVCTINAADGNYVTRVPNFVLTGPYGGQFSVTKTGSIGQRLTRNSSGVYAFTNDGIERKLTYNGAILARYTTTTTGNGVIISGSTRSGSRTSAALNNGTSGALVVTNNLSGNVCTFTGTLTSASTCNCPTSGTMTASCTGGSTASLALTGCGTGNYSTNGGAAESVTLDQCTSL